MIEAKVNLPPRRSLHLKTVSLNLPCLQIKIQSNLHEMINKSEIKITLIRSKIIFNVINYSL